MEKTVQFVLPLEEKQVIKSVPVLVDKNEETIYDFFGYFEDHVYKEFKIKCYKCIFENDFPLGNLINLHDEDAINIKKINKMSNFLKSKKHILTKSGLPNIKIVKSRRNELIVFDGHHTLISYMNNNKNYLSEVPFVLINSTSGFDDEHIKVFYGKHKKRLKDDDWRNYSINWNEKKDFQISPKKRYNMSELYNAFLQKQVL